MKLQNNTPDTVTSNMEVAGQFTIKNSSKAFKILSSGLYANKEKAIVRELSCNCVDSHTARDKMWDEGVANPAYIAPKGTPFLVHLPSSIEPYLAIRDYGIGLDHDGVTKLYTTYFESTKQDSNDYIGALGLGSKSPFSYTHNFTVTATFNGYRRVYTAYINEQGIPALMQMAEGPIEDFIEDVADDPLDAFNGLEVRIPVLEREDFGTFIEEAQEVFKWFSDKDKPNVVGNSSYSPRTITYVEQDIIPGCHIVAGYRRGGCFAVQGNIAYPIELPWSVRNKLTEHQTAVLEENMVMEFDLGELDIAASREELGYIPLTIDNIKAKIDAVIDGSVEYVKNELESITDEWAKARRAMSLLEKEITAIGVKKMLEDDIDSIQLLALKDKPWGSGKEVKWDFDQIALRPSSEFFKGFDTLRFFEDTYSSKTPLAEAKGFAEDNVMNYYLPRNADSVVRVVYNDTKRGCITRIKNHDDFGKNDLVILAEKEGVENELVAESIKTHLQTMFFNIPVEIHKASDLNEHTTARTSIKTSILKLVSKEKGYWDSKVYYTWTSATMDITDDSCERLYIPLSGYTVLDDNDEKIHEWTTMYASLLGKLDIFEGVDIYGVRKGQINEVRELSHWKSAHVYLKEKVKELLDQYDPTLIEYRNIDSKVFPVANCEYLVKNMSDKNSDIYKLAEKVIAAESIEITGTKLTNLKQAAVNYGLLANENDLNTTTSTSANEELTKIFAEYELLDTISDSYYRVSPERLLRYINLVDNSKGETNE